MKIPVLYQLEKLFNKKIKKTLKRKFDEYIIHHFRMIILRKYKYIHVMNNGIHSVGAIKFIQKYFNNSEHAFIFPILKDETKPKLAGMSRIYKYQLEDIPLKKIKKIVFHGLFTQPFIDFLYKHPKYLEKSYWFIWGGDLYNRVDTKASQYVKKNMKGILTSFDYDIYQDKYGDKKCYDVTYPHDITESMIKPKSRSKKSLINIMINNSADETTLEMFDILAKFKNKNIRIYTILSYISENQKDPRLKIMKKGYETFGQKFIPIIDFMDKIEYANFLSTVDIYISNQNRQQGNGNASFICSLGGKVFTKSDTSVYKKYNSLGIRYFDTYDIPKLSFNEFIMYPDEVKKQTIEKLKYRMLDSTKVKQWKEFFLDD